MHAAQAFRQEKSISDYFVVIKGKPWQIVEGNDLGRSGIRSGCKKTRTPGEKGG